MLPFFFVDIHFYYYGSFYRLSTTAVLLTLINTEYAMTCARSDNWKANLEPILPSCMTVLSGICGSVVSVPAVETFK